MLELRLVLRLPSVLPSPSLRPPKTHNSVHGTGFHDSIHSAPISLLWLCRCRSFEANTSLSPVETAVVRLGGGAFSRELLAHALQRCLTTEPEESEHVKKEVGCVGGSFELSTC